MDKSKLRKLFFPLFFLVLIIFEEVIFSLTVFNKLDFSLLYIVLFSIPLSGVFYFLSSIFKSKINHILAYLFIIFIIIFYAAQFIYNQVYQSVISLYSMASGAGQVMEFKGKILEVMKVNWWVILLIILPLILLIILDIVKKSNYERVSVKAKLCYLVWLIVVQGFAILTVNILPDENLYSAKNLYYNVHAPLLTSEKFGVATMMRLDIQRTIFGFKEKDLVSHIDITPPPVIEEEVKYNMLDIDFETLINNETDEVLKDMYTYFSLQQPTEQNEYTGMFEGKNLIVIVAEAFSELAIDEELTPNLYKLYSEGFQFENFYTPLFPVSTADGEYITDTSLIPKEGVWSLYQVRNNYMPFSYANVFEKLGYTSQAYHNNTGTYYKRNEYIAAMGYDSYRACKMGLNITCGYWPQSDVEMVNDTYLDFINDDKFLAYFMTVSGHLEYTRVGNRMVTKNWSYVKDLPYSDKAKSYLAANIELDRAVGVLLEKLEEAGKLENTVISITGDHYPYGLELSEVNELSTYVRDENFEIHHMPWLLWSGDMTNPIKVETLGSSLDVIPTLYNLFGIEFDSRLFIGHDILSNADPLIIFSNRSFITDKGRYNAISKEFTKVEGQEIDNEYVSLINAIIYNKYKYSRLILEKDFYRELYNDLGLLS